MKKSPALKLNDTVRYRWLQLHITLANNPRQTRQQMRKQHDGIAHLWKGSNRVVKNSRLTDEWVGKAFQVTGT